MPYRTAGREGIRYNQLPFYFAYADSLPNGVNAIVATSDLQGREHCSISNKLLGMALVEEIEILESLAIVPKAPLILSSGDLYDSPDLNKLGSTGDVTPVLNEFSSAFDEAIVVHGNHDIVSDKELSDRIKVLDGTNVKSVGISISGVAGIIGRPGKNQRKSEVDYKKLLIKSLSHKPDILLLHQSPQGDLPDQIGDVSTRECLLRYGDALVISGHCYWKNHLAKIGSNQILNVDSKVIYILNK